MSTIEIAAKHALELAAKAIEIKYLKFESNASKLDITPKNLESHLVYIANWSAETHIFGPETTKRTDSESIKLLYDNTARKFRGRRTNDVSKTEDTVLHDYSHLMLIGDPGAGKTTSLKRIALSVLKPRQPDDTTPCHLPILLRLKELEQYSDIHQHLADLLGFPVRIKERVIVDEIKRRDIDDNGKEIAVTEKIERRIPYPAIGDTDINRFMENYLNESRALVLIDGLDELRQDLFAKFIVDIRDLALRLTTSKIIITSRTGFYYSLGTMERFSVLDILPLASEQIYALAKIWTKSPDDFVRALNASPYNDLANRPLLLCQLLFIFDRYGTLPPQPKDIYEIIVDLLLKEWDANRHIVRSSKYSAFTSKRKATLLAEIAFHLMYKNNSTRFGTRELIDVYDRIHMKYELPASEAEDVAREIETHTGIVISVGHLWYEFSHLSIQEYLCADYIVRAPLNRDTVNLIKRHSEPYAIAISLASEASGWFSTLITDQDSFDALTPSIGAFISRLVVERPVFEPGDLVGFCVYYAYVEAMRSGAKGYLLTKNHRRDAHTEPTRKHDEDMSEVFRRLADLTGIRESVRLFLEEPKQVEISNFGRGKNKQISVTYTLPKQHFSHSTYSKEVVVAQRYFDRFLNDFGFCYKGKKLVQKQLNEHPMLQSPEPTDEACV